MRDELSPIKRYLRWLAAGLALGSAGLTFHFGFEAFGLLVAICLVGASIASAYLWPVVLDEWRQGRWRIAAIGAVVALLASVTDATTNFGSITSARDVDLTTAEMSTVRYDDTRAAVAENEATLAALETKRQALVMRAGWQTEGAPAAGELQAQIARMEGDLLFGPKRTKGCTDATLPDSRAFCEQYAAVKGQLAVVEEHAALMAQAERIKALLADARGKAANTVVEHSGARAQNVALASMFTRTLHPTEAAQHWTDKGIAWLVAAFLTIAALGLNLLVWSNREPERGHLSIKELQAKADQRVVEIARPSNGIHGEGHTPPPPVVAPAHSATFNLSSDKFRELIEAVRERTGGALPA